MGSHSLYLLCFLWQPAELASLTWQIYTNIHRESFLKCISHVQPPGMIKVLRIYFINMHLRIVYLVIFDSIGCTLLPSSFSAYKRHIVNAKKLIDKVCYINIYIYVNHCWNVTNKTLIILLFTNTNTSRLEMLDIIAIFVWVHLS